MPQRSKKDSTSETLYYNILRKEVWKKAIGNNHIAKGNHYYESIKKKIKEETDYNLSKDTIRNFLEAKHTPQPKPLDIYSSYVLGGEKTNPKTFKDFQNWHHGKSIFDKFALFISKSKFRFIITIVILGIIILLISSVLYNQKPSPEAFQEIYSNKNATSAPNARILKTEFPNVDIIQDYFKEFQFDENQFASKTEAQKMMEWLGIREMNYYSDAAESYFSGYLDSGCKASIWIGANGKSHIYGIRCSFDSPDTNLIPFYVEIPKPRRTTDFFKRFYNSDLKELEKDGWSLAFDSINLNLWGNPKYKNSGYLTLETFLGDSFLENKDYDPQIINILSHKLNCGSCCEIKVKIVGFNPYQRYQKAGFYLFYNESSVPSQSYNFVGIENRTSHVEAIKRDGKYSNVNVIPSSVRSIISKFKNGKLENKVDSIILKLVIEDKEYSFLRKVNQEEYVTVKTRRIDFPLPQYIGLAACQGRPEIPLPTYDIADTIPAHFEYVQIKSCE